MAGCARRKVQEEPDITARCPQATVEGEALIAAVGSGREDEEEWEDTDVTSWCSENGTVEEEAAIPIVGSEREWKRKRKRNWLSRHAAYFVQGG